MVKLISALGLLSAVATLSVASPVQKRQDTTAASGTAAETGSTTAADSTGTDTAATSAPASSSAAGSGAAAPGTTITAFVPNPGGPPNATLYAVTGANETYLVGLEVATATDSAGNAVTTAIGDVFVVGDDELDVYVFDQEGNPIEATECEISDDGTTAVCNGIVIDVADQEIVAFSNLTITGALSGVPAYLPTDTAGDPVGVSYATNAPSRISAFTGDGGISVSTVTLGNATVTGQASTMLSELPGAGSDSAAESVATATATGTEGGSASSTGTEAAAGTEATAAASTSA